MTIDASLPLSRRMFGTTAVAVGLFAVATACGSGGTASSPTTAKDQSGGTMAGTIKVSDAWARASVQGQPNGAAYFIVQNDGAADRLLKATGPADLCDKTEVHEVVPATPGSTMPAGHDMPATTMAGGHQMPATTAASGAAPGSTAPAMMMREVAGIDIPAKGKVEFKPGGYHIMFIKLKKQIAKGDKFNLTLKFENAGDINVEVVARER